MRRKNEDPTEEAIGVLGTLANAEMSAPKPSKDATSAPVATSVSVMSSAPDSPMFTLVNETTTRHPGGALSAQLRSR